MICQPCRNGADLVSEHEPLLSLSTYSVARMMHDRCQGCDCQHNVDAQVEGKALR